MSMTDTTWESLKARKVLYIVYMRNFDIMLSWVEHEKSFNYLVARCGAHQKCANRLLQISLIFRILFKKKTKLHNKIHTALLIKHSIVDSLR